MKTVPMPKRRTSPGRFAAWVTLAAAGFLIACALANLIIGATLKARNPPLGEIYNVDGHGMHLYCVGAGSPTILLEAGAGDDVLYWQTIQPELAKVTRVCSYDRAGIGWSDPQTGKRDSEAIVRQLHALLDAAGVARPLVLAGASAGGFHVREYVREFPNEVLGVALLDSSSTRQVDELPGSRAWYDAERVKRPRQVHWEKIKVALGWQRLLGRCRADVPPPLERLRAAFDAEECRPQFVGGDVGEFLSFEDSGREADRLTSLGDRALVVISQDPDRAKPGWTADAIAGQPVWAREQEQLKLLSSRSWRVVARGSSHHIHWDRPDVVTGEISRLIAYLRGGSPPPFGSTVTE